MLKEKLNDLGKEIANVTFASLGEKVKDLYNDHKKPILIGLAGASLITAYFVGKKHGDTVIYTSVYTTMKSVHD